MTPDEITSADGSPALPPCSFCNKTTDLTKDALYTATDHEGIAICGECVLSMTRTALGVPEGVDVVLLALPPETAQAMFQPVQDAMRAEMPSKATH